jgi:glycosyltransferase involved in cell wall biosynthesis
MLTVTSPEGPAMEAMACRTPVVSTRTGGPAEVVESGWNGILLEVDVRMCGQRELACAIERVLLQPEPEWMRLSLNAFSDSVAKLLGTERRPIRKSALNAQTIAPRRDIAGGR